jgi:cysteine desulfurase
MTGQLKPKAESEIYLDHAASAPLMPAVAAKHAEYCREYFANPHATGLQSAKCLRAVLRAEQQILQLLGIPEEQVDVVWTSGGTEAANLACLGYLRGLRQGVCAVSATAHSAVLEPCRSYAEEGGHYHRLPVDETGQLKLPDAPPQALDLVAVEHVNNETGTVLDLVALRRWMNQHAPQAKLVVDALQSVGKMTIPWREAKIDLLLLGGRKFGGPASVGALIRRRGTPLQPLLYGGGQQHGLRPGTLDVVGILEFADALRIASGEQQEHWKRIGELNGRLRSRLEAMPGISARMLSPGDASPFILCVSFPGYDGAVLMRCLAEYGMVVATGSACRAESDEVSHVMTAMGVTAKVARGVLRISFGADNTWDQLECFLESLGKVLNEY